MIKKIPFFIALTAIVIFLATPFFIKVRVECKSQYGACPSDIVSALDRFSGLSVYSAESKIKKALKGNLLVSGFSIQFKLPNNLSVNIILIKPSFAAVDRSSGKIGLVDTSGRILSVSDSTTLPKVTTDINLKTGTFVDEKTLFALKIIGGVYEMYQIDNGEIQNNSLLVELPSRFTVTFPLEGDTQVLLGELRLVYARAQNSADLASYSQIDLRFKNPVLR